jgi:hypothetical protein
MTTKKPATMLRLEAYIEPIKSNLAYDAAPILEDAFLTLHDAIEAAVSEETTQALIDDWFAARPHLLKTVVLIPEPMQEAAFGDNPALKAQGDLLRRYGQAAAEECARRWKTTLGSTKSGRNPHGGVSVASAKKVLDKAEAEAPSKNPWHPRFPAKTPQERLAAQTSILKAMGSKAAERMARSVGMTLGGQPLRK